MPSSDNRSNVDRLIQKAKKEQSERARSYREQALKILPWICGRCAREFGRERLKELTVHHKDGNHDNNPADGSNWELLCIYCHENEHARYEDAKAGELGSGSKSKNPEKLDPDPVKHRPWRSLGSF